MLSLKLIAVLFMLSSGMALIIMGTLGFINRPSKERLICFLFGHMFLRDTKFRKISPDGTRILWECIRCGKVISIKRSNL